MPMSSFEGKGTFNLQQWVAARPTEQFEVAAVTVAELWHGVERATGARQAQRQQYLQTILASLPVIPYTEQIAHEHARVWAELESAGKMIRVLPDIAVKPRLSGRGYKAF